VWREALLAQAVLAGRTTGYRHHPQLQRFTELPDPLAGIGSYLLHVALEADARGYRFARDRIIHPDEGSALVTTTGQLAFEWAHLLRKLETRDPLRWRSQRTSEPVPHPLVRVVPGPIETWERP
jgi:hypothetical protein